MHDTLSKLLLVQDQETNNIASNINNTNVSQKTIFPQTLILPYNYRLFASDIIDNRTGGGEPPLL